MPKAKKKKVEQANETVVEHPAPPAAPEPAVPSSPERQQVKRERPAQSPGMKQVKAVAYDARKAKKVADKARAAWLKAKAAQVQHCKRVAARMDGILRSWKKAGARTVPSGTWSAAMA